MKVIANVSYLDFTRTPFDYGKGFIESELKTIHFATGRARVVFDNPTKANRKEALDIPLKNIESNSLRKFFEQWITNNYD